MRALGSVHSVLLTVLAFQRDLSVLWRDRKVMRLNTGANTVYSSTKHRTQLETGKKANPPAGPAED